MDVDEDAAIRSGYGGLCHSLSCFRQLRFRERMPGLLHTGPCRVEPWFGGLSVRRVTSASTRHVAMAVYRCPPAQRRRRTRLPAAAVAKERSPSGRVHTSDFFDWAAETSERSIVPPVIPHLFATRRSVARCAHGLARFAPSLALSFTGLTASWGAISAGNRQPVAAGGTHGVCRTRGNRACSVCGATP